MAEALKKAVAYPKQGGIHVRRIFSISSVQTACFMLFALAPNVAQPFQNIALGCATALLFIFILVPIYQAMETQKLLVVAGTSIIHIGKAYLQTAFLGLILGAIIADDALDLASLKSLLHSFRIISIYFAGYSLIISGFWLIWRTGGKRGRRRRKSQFSAS